MQTKQDSLSHEELVNLIEYCPEAGIVRWKVSNHRVSAGDVLGSTTSATANGKTYARVKIAQKTYRLHRIIWFYMTKTWPTDCIDHIDGNSLNNKWNNLRLATYAENGKNIKVNPRNKTGIRGLCKRGSIYWHASITSDGRQYQKVFEQTQEGKEKAIAWLKAMRSELHKEFSSEFKNQHLN